MGYTNKDNTQYRQKERTAAYSPEAMILMLLSNCNASVQEDAFVLLASNLNRFLCKF